MNTLPTANIKRIEESTFFDTCIVDVFSSGSTSKGDITKVYTSGSVISCGITNNSGNKVYSPDGVIFFSYDYIVRISLDVAIKSTDCITLKTKSGNAVNQRVDIINLQVGTGCYIAKCKSVEV